MLRRSYIIWPVVILIFLSAPLIYGRTGMPLELITEEEASLPDSDELHFEAGIEEGGPIIEVIAPENGKTYAPPLQIVVKFVPRDGSAIDISTLKVEYLKWLSINITDRVIPYTTRDGIKAEKVNLPSGTHKIRLSIGDVTGATTAVQMMIVIQ